MERAADESSFLFLSVWGEVWDTFPPDLSLPPGCPCCCGGETWVMAGFERDFFICLEPRVLSLLTSPDVFEHLHPGLHQNGAPFVLSPSQSRTEPVSPLPVAL